MSITHITLMGMVIVVFQNQDHPYDPRRTHGTQGAYGMGAIPLAFSCAHRITGNLYEQSTSSWPGRVSLSQLLHRHSHSPKDSSPHLRPTRSRHEPAQLSLQCPSVQESSSVNDDSALLDSQVQYAQGSSLTMPPTDIPALKTRVIILLKSVYLQMRTPKH